MSIFAASGYIHRITVQLRVIVGPYGQTRAPQVDFKARVMQPNQSANDRDVARPV